MRKYLISFLFILILLVSCTQKNKVHYLTGVITDINGKIPAIINVHIYSIGGDQFKPLETTQTKADGSFKISIPKKKMLEVMITAADHPKLQFPFINRVDKDTEMKIVMKNNDYTSDFSQVKILGDWNHFNWGSAVKMLKQKDGTYSFNAKASADTVGYQLLNLVKDNRSVNGTNWDYLIYDGGGDYISVVKAKNGKAKIVFDPKKLEKAPTENKAQVIITKGDITMQPFIDISLRMDDMNSVREKAAQIYYKQAGSLIGFRFQAQNLLQYLKQKMGQPDSLLAKYAALQMAKFWSISGDVSNTDMQKIIGRLPISDKMWQSAPLLATRIYTVSMGESKADSLFRKQLKNIDNKKIKAAILIQLGLNAKENNNLQEMARIYNQIREMQADIPGIDYFEDQLNPNKRIIKGKQLPDFSFKALDSGKIISKKSLLGKYYIMDFWATWCSPCIAEMPSLHNAYARFKNSNFTILSLSFDRSPNEVHHFRNGKWKMPWLHVFLTPKERIMVRKDFEVSGIPKPILVSPKGKILATETELRGDNLRRSLLKYLK